MIRSVLVSEMYPESTPRTIPILRTAVGLTSALRALRQLFRNLVSEDVARLEPANLHSSQGSDFPVQCLRFFEADLHAADDIADEKLSEMTREEFQAGGV